MQKFPGQPQEFPATTARRLRHALALLDSLRFNRSANPDGDLHLMRDAIRGAREEVDRLNVAHGASRAEAVREAEGIAAGFGHPHQHDAETRFVYIRGKLLAALSARVAHAARP